MGVTRQASCGGEGYKGGGEICPTLTAGKPEIYYYEGVEERDMV